MRNEGKLNELALNDEGDGYDDRNNEETIGKPENKGSCCRREREWISR